MNDKSYSSGFAAGIKLALVIACLLSVFNYALTVNARSIREATGAAEAHPVWLIVFPDGDQTIVSCEGNSFNLRCF